MRTNVIKTPIVRELEDLKKKINVRIRRAKTSRLREFTDLVIAIIMANILTEILTSGYRALVALLGYAI